MARCPEHPDSATFTLNPELLNIYPNIEGAASVLWSILQTATLCRPTGSESSLDRDEIYW